MSEEVLTREFLGFALAMASLALSGSIARFLGLPIFLGYLLAGLLAQPFLSPFPSLALLGKVGVILLLFFLGMEFDWRALLASRKRLFLTLVDLLLNFFLPFSFLLIVGLPYASAFIIAMAIYPTSSALTLGALFQLRRVANPETETIVWILVGEDLAIILLLAISSGLTGEALGLKGTLLAISFVGVMFVASVVLTRPLEWLFKRVPSELDNVVTFSLIVLFSAIAHLLKLSEALGAFLAGLIFSGTRDREELETRLNVLRDLGTSAFFFSFGLQVPLKISPWGLALGGLILILGVWSKVLTGWISGLIEGLRPRARFRLIFSLWIRGEFSIIALFMGKSVLPSIWQESMSWFILGSVIVGLLALSYGEKHIERGKGIMSKNEEASNV
jgi:CPA2 family monovalent cation:H+ antiporter-2